MERLKLKEKVYYARIMPTLGIYDVHDIILRRIEEDWFVGIDSRDKRAYMFNAIDLDNIVFLDRLEAVNKTLEAEQKAPKMKFTTDKED